MENLEENFNWNIQADGWKMYDNFIKRNSIWLLCCMAHAKRKIDESKESKVIVFEIPQIRSQFYNALEYSNINLQGFT